MPLDLIQGRQGRIRGVLVEVKGRAFRALVEAHTIQRPKQSWKWVQAKRARDFTVSDAIQAELEARGVEPKLARPDPKKAGENPFDAGGGACNGGSMMAMAMMSNTMNMSM